MKRTIYMDEEARELLDRARELFPDAPVSDLFRRGLRALIALQSGQDVNVREGRAAEKLRRLADELEGL